MMETLTNLLETSLLTVNQKMFQGRIRVTDRFLGKTEADYSAVHVDILRNHEQLIDLFSIEDPFGSIDA